MDRAVILRADGGVSLFPWHSSSQAAETFAKWHDSARSQWLPATMEKTSLNVTQPMQSFHGSRGPLANWGTRISDSALEWFGGELVVNMPNAREVVVNRLRPERNKRLDEQDIEYTRADERDNSAEKQRIGRLRQSLRDYPATARTELNTLNTPEELVAWEPTWPT